MKINVKKTKVICLLCSKGTKIKIVIDGQRVEEFKYLGSVVTADGYCEKDIRSTIAMWKKAFMDKRKLFRTPKLDLWKRISKCFVWSVALYVTETWT